MGLGLWVFFRLVGFGLVIFVLVLLFVGWLFFFSSKASVEIEKYLLVSEKCPLFSN